MNVYRQQAAYLTPDLIMIATIEMITSIVAIMQPDGTYQLEMENGYKPLPKGCIRVLRKGIAAGQLQLTPFGRRMGTYRVTGR